MNELALFAGAGGGILGGKLLGWRTVCAVEKDPYARDVLVARQNDGCLPPFPIWDDVCTFDGRPWKGIVDVVSGGFPCQDISAAGKGAGIKGKRSGLWNEMARIIGEVRPYLVFVENSPLLVRRGLVIVLSNLTSMGYDAQWCCIGASNVGAPHERKRIWIVASNANGSQCKGRKLSGGKNKKHTNTSFCPWWKNQPGILGVAYGVANQMDRLKAIGNGQVPAVAALAWNILTEDCSSITNTNE